ncbi:MAG: hypothetical protein AAFN07_04285 [Pseudomonadota bacterium]
MLNFRQQMLALALVGSLPLAASADDDFWIAGRAGTQGLGLEATWRAVPYLDFRLGISQFGVDFDSTEAGIDYETEVDLSNIYATANFRVPLSPFRVSAGVVNNRNEGSLFAPQQSSITVGNQTFDGALVGNLRGSATFDDFAPYAGIGFDFRFANRVGLHIDAGVMYQGEASLTLAADGALATDAIFQQELESERQELEEELSDYRLFPVIALSLSVNF